MQNSFFLRLPDITKFLLVIDRDVFWTELPYMMREANLSYSDIMTMPISNFLILRESIADMIDKTNKAIKDRR